MLVRFNRAFVFDRGDKGGTVHYSGGHEYVVDDLFAAQLMEGDDPIASDPNAAPVETATTITEPVGVKPPLDDLPAPDDGDGSED